MILDSIYESENFGKGWLGYNIMPRAPTAVFVELLICASLVVALVMTPLTKKLVQRLWQQRQITGHVPMFVGKPSKECTEWGRCDLTPSMVLYCLSLYGQWLLFQHVWMLFLLAKGS